MKDQAKPKFETSTPCGVDIIKRAQNSQLAHHFYDHTHILSVANDYAALWSEATTDDERISIWKEFRKAIRSCYVYSMTFDGIHGYGLHFIVTNPEYAIHSLIFMYAIFYLMTMYKK